MNAFVAPLGGLLGAVIGGILWAKWSHIPGFIAIGIGLLTGAGMLFTSSRSFGPRCKDDMVSCEYWRGVFRGNSAFLSVNISMSNGTQSRKSQHN